VEDLLELEDSRFLAYFHQSMQKAWKKAWHDWHIKSKLFMQGDFMLLYENKYKKHLGNIQIHWLGPFIVVEICEYGAVKLA
jgi:hypothetical protein